MHISINLSGTDCFRVRRCSCFGLLYKNPFGNQFILVMKDRSVKPHWTSELSKTDDLDVAYVIVDNGLYLIQFGTTYWRGTVLRY